jgi:hypothetical protein
MTFPGILSIDIGVGFGISRHDGRGMPVAYASPRGDHTKRPATACDSHRPDDVASLELASGSHPLPNTTPPRMALHDADPICCRFFIPARGHVCKCADNRDRSLAPFARVSRRLHHHCQYESDVSPALPSLHAHAVNHTSVRPLTRVVSDVPWPSTMCVCVAVCDYLCASVCMCVSFVYVLVSMCECVI